MRICVTTSIREHGISKANRGLQHPSRRASSRSASKLRGSAASSAFATIATTSSSASMRLTTACSCAHWPSVPSKPSVSSVNDVTYHTRTRWHDAKPSSCIECFTHIFDTGNGSRLCLFVLYMNTTNISIK